MVLLLLLPTSMGPSKDGDGHPDHTDGDHDGDCGAS